MALGRMGGFRSIGITYSFKHSAAKNGYESGGARGMPRKGRKKVLLLRSSELPDLLGAASEYAAVWRSGVLCQ